MDGTGTLFEPLVKALGSEFDVVIVRYPNTDPIGYSDLQVIASAALPKEGPFVILGESFSGPIAISIAQTCSSRLKGIVLCCTFVRNPQPSFSILRSLIDLIPVKATPLNALSFLLLGRSSTFELKSALAQALDKIDPAVIRARVKAVLAVDVSAQFLALKVPSLYLRALRDRVIPKAALELVTNLSPRTEVVQLDAPHFLLQAVPAEAARVISSFMRRVEFAVKP